jgi:hypothetical protein
VSATFAALNIPMINEKAFASVSGGGVFLLSIIPFLWCGGYRVMALNPFSIFLICEGFGIRGISPRPSFCGGVHSNYLMPSSSAANIVLTTTPLFNPISTNRKNVSI